jgi:glycosyltransferase involved in cell wall biosynthesis
LEFISVTIPVRSRDDSIRTLQWKSTDDSFAECTKLTATVPIADRRSGFEPLSASVEIASVSSLESAGERLALFSRLMQDHSLASLEKKTVASSTSGMRASGVVANQTRRDPNKFLPPEQLGPFGSLRVAIVHDFLYTYAGAERVVEQLIELFPHSDLFALFDFLDEEDRHFLRGKTVSTSFLQHMPLIRRNHRMYLPLMPLSVEQLDVSQYDLVVSSSYLAAKGVLTGPDQLHICYCHSPARYAWDLQHQYLNESGLGFGAKGMLARTILHYLRSWDVRSALGVDFFIANSKFVARRIDKVYRRDAVVVYPPVDTNYFTPSSDRREDYYVAVGRLVPYKQTELIVAAFNLMPDQKLKIIGDGPDLDKVRHLAGPNVEILGYQDNDFVRHHVQHAKALIFAAEEDFGIVPVEAMACGTPVIAYAKGGVVETVVDGKCGVLFAEQSANSIRDAVREFEDTAFDYDLAQCELHRHAERFSEERFVGRMTDVIGQWVMQKWPDQAALHRRRDTPILVNPASGFDTSGASTTPPWMTAANSAETNGHH